MGINITVIAALLVVLIFAIIGLKRGLIMSVYHLISVILIFILTIVANPYVSKWMKGNEKIYGSLYEKVEKNINVPQINVSGAESFIENTELPESVREYLHNASQEYIDNKLDAAQKSFADYVHEKLTNLIISCIAFIVTFIAAIIAVTLVFKLMDLISKLPGLKEVNKFSGLLVGLAEGIIIVWIACGLIPLISSTDFGKTIIEDIYENKVMTFLYENNFISTVISGRILTIFSKAEA